MWVAGPQLLETSSACQGMNQQKTRVRSGTRTHTQELQWHMCQIDVLTIKVPFHPYCFLKQHAICHSCVWQWKIRCEEGWANAETGLGAHPSLLLSVEAEYVPEPLKPSFHTRRTRQALLLDLYPGPLSLFISACCPSVCASVTPSIMTMWNHEKHLK